MPKNINVSLRGDTVPYPTAYRVHEMVLTNHAGRKYDIYPLVTDFTITESIYTPSLLISINIKDPVNMLEELELSGQEKITVSIWKSRNTGNETEEHHVQHEFLISEYPIYGKFKNHLQVYTVKGISPHVFYAKFKRISRAWNGPIQDFVYDILTKDLKYNPSFIRKSKKQTANVSFIVPNLNPIDAIAWALRRAYDETGSPWYCYESLQEGGSVPGGTIWILPQSDLSSFYEQYSDYEEAVVFTHSPNTPEDFEQRRKRILSISSRFNMSKYISGGNGAYGATTEYVDISTKSRVRKKFDYIKEFPQMQWSNEGINLASDFKLDDQTLASLPDAKLNYIPINSKAFSSGSGNYHSSTQNGMLNRANSYIENLENIIHDLTLAGDFYMNAGNKLELKLPKAIDPSAKVKGSKHSDVGDYDLLLSGQYIATSVVHNFNEEHTCEVRVKRDSMTQKFTA